MVLGLNLMCGCKCVDLRQTYRMHITIQSINRYNSFTCSLTLRQKHQDLICTDRERPTTTYNEQTGLLHSEQVHLVAS